MNTKDELDKLYKRVYKNKNEKQANTKKIIKKLLNDTLISLISQIHDIYNYKLIKCIYLIISFFLIYLVVKN